MQDAFSGHAVGLTSPATRPETITRSDAVELTRATRSLYVRQTGNVGARTAEGDDVTPANMQVRALYPARAVQIYLTGSAATDLVGLS